MALDLSAFARVSLGHWPTPLDECPRLGAALGGVRVLVKRDDVSGLGVGGNKLRKLEFLLAAAVDGGADTVITFGALQTNHGRLTAAACARLGLRCELILTRDVPRTGEAYERSGNMALHTLYGATVHLCDDQRAVDETYAQVVERATAAGHTIATIPVGGSNALGVLGYVAATDELFTQLDAAGVVPDRLVVPVGSAGTVAGVALATELLGRSTRVVGACVSHTAAESLADIRRLTGEAAALLGAPEPTLAGVHTDDRAVGPGYGIPTDQMWAAVRLFAETEGITLDPVYTGKAAACLVDQARTGEIAPGETVVFLHTGGLPGLFAYAPDLRT
ncbi:D-cysteine desulfhydrase family protein [Actinokineospora sp. NBRC 105648]|uniref:1-aminocyclopropane-1-carboxylate deaminase/D-cysteine desulfhydrase n=1 Tax=Actinokineospora sp. NBRC 105648 TaxID=3032206 RepID=UPI0024A4C197|nr:D-cysteine desulfhydrase family protein [Actinokineospora sp. NBRC 105648]GLZ39543.1 1-aminocyclopropane-1-carboxylate deaminase [Actinokineospora sp. NBRC 105648]